MLRPPWTSQTTDLQQREQGQRDHAAQASCPLTHSTGLLFQAVGVWSGLSFSKIADSIRLDKKRSLGSLVSGLPWPLVLRVQRVYTLPTLH